MINKRQAHCCMKKAPIVHWYSTLAESWIKPVGKTGSSNFPTDTAGKFPTNSCKFQTQKITSAQNLNLALKFPQNGGDFQIQILYF